MPREPTTLIIGSTINEVMALAAYLDIAMAPSTYFVIMGSPLFTPWGKAYASVDLMPEVRTPEEDRWFKAQLGNREALVQYVDFE